MSEQVFTIRTNKSQAIEIWAKKEYGSWEDHNYDKDHVYAILSRFGGLMKLNKDQIQRLIKSGQHLLSFDDEDVNGNDDPEVGRKTKLVVQRYITRLELLIN